MSPGHFGTASDGVYEIPQEWGALNGSEDLLFHSFSDFDLAHGDTAVFTGQSSIETVVSHVTGEASEIDGTIRSEIENADF